jgi:hypothetical protein
MDFRGACRRLGAELVAAVAAARIMLRDKTGGSGCEVSMCYTVSLHNNRLEAGVLLQNCIMLSSLAGFRSDATHYSDAWIHETTGFIGYDAVILW